MTKNASDPVAFGHLAPVMLNQLARYAPAISLVDEVLPENVLEVGSGSEGLARFRLDHYAITICDRDFSDYGSVEIKNTPGSLLRVEGDVTELPFSNGEFDVVLALDLLEHVPASSRPLALRELARVTRVRAIIGCPCGPSALEADRHLGRLYDFLPRRQRPVWLEEHLENGFPEGEEIKAVLAEFGRVRLQPNERLRERQLVSIVEAIPLIGRATLLLAARLEAGLSGADRYSGWQSRMLTRLRGGDRGVTYRQLAVLDR